MCVGRGVLVVPSQKKISPVSVEHMLFISFVNSERYALNVSPSTPANLSRYKLY